MIKYTLTRKRNMKNIVIRIRDRSVIVSAPLKVPQNEINIVVQSKTDWIEKQLLKPPVQKSELKPFDINECLHKFEEIAEKVYPLVADKLSKQPKMYVKPYKSRWGVAYPKRDYIILNTQLFDKPIEAIEYVILHEYVHFLIPNHGEKFYELIRELVPDYIERRKLLRRNENDLSEM